MLQHPVGWGGEAQDRGCCGFECCPAHAVPTQKEGGSPGEVLCKKRAKKACKGQDGLGRQGERKGCVEPVPNLHVPAGNNPCPAGPDLPCYGRVENVGEVVLGTPPLLLPHREPIARKEGPPAFPRKLRHIAPSYGKDSRMGIQGHKTKACTVCSGSASLPPKCGNKCFSKIST